MYMNHKYIKLSETEFKLPFEKLNIMRKLKPLAKVNLLFERDKA